MTLSVAHFMTNQKANHSVNIGQLSELTALKGDATAISDMLDDVLKQFAKLGVSELNVSAVQRWQLLSYLNMLLLWNKAYNLTAISDPKTAFVKHIVDCLAMVAHLPTDKPASKLASDACIRLLDVGTGAGLPAMVIAICRPDVQCVALDSNQKKVRFIKQATSELGVANCVAVASRIETHTGSYDWITSRAFANLQAFAEVVTPYLTDSGCLLAMKARLPDVSALDVDFVVHSTDSQHQKSHQSSQGNQQSITDKTDATDAMLSETTEQYAQLATDWYVKIIELDVPYLNEPRHLVTMQAKQNSRLLT